MIEVPMRRVFEAVTAVLLVLVVAGLLAVALLPLAPAVFTRTTPLVPQASLPAVAPAHVESEAPAAEAVSRSAVADAVEPVLADAPAAAGRLFGAVVDVATGDVLYSRSGDEIGVPASSLKTVTAAAALSVLGEDSRRATEVYLDGDAVVLVGGGDVLLTDEGIEELAAEAAEALAEDADDDGRTLHVVLDDTLFAGSTLSPHWDASLVTSNNIAPVMPIAMNAARTSEAKAAPRASDPAMSAALAFHRALAAALDDTGVALGDDVVRGGRGAKAEPIANLESATTVETVRVMTEDSENYVAETLGRLVALESGQPASFGGVSAALTAAVENMGVETAGLRLVDASGLAAANRISPEQLAGVLAAASVSGSRDLREVSYMLPIAGATGTLSERLDSDATRGKVRAKTGTLAGVVTLTGYVVTDGGRLLAFSFFAEDVPGALGDSRDVLDAAAAELAGL
ncbi:D-alanyl-D-alanine carboxypeptidase/D-alanyl-D-alanine endopeptidase [Zhihengliuella halotolerans]|uniref:D-alanyl-D-alanine carboxypeptidase/D-alanyl-D-alanine endopeptidase n=1 Tax=Zhihengliuella halotolerans TaxID=370736 RepID=UPI000C80A87E|nr:D-alanyl-D-alanine carboxypeptidase/D-alanyl-D-alanine-endopeptidase [Zhihengliuella halotolerans]